MRVYISENTLSKKPEHCADCPICSAESGDCLLLLKFYGTWEEQYSDCPLREKYQPNPFNSVVQLLRDFDIHDEEIIKDLADHICLMFKDGAYD